MKKLLFIEKGYSFFFTFGLYAWKIVGLLLEKFGTFVRAALYLNESSFWKKNNYFKKHVFLSLWDLECRGKKLIFDNILSALLSKFILSLQINNLSFLEQFLSFYLFWDPSKICWDFLRKTFGTFVETAFYVYRQTIWGETIFSKEYSSSHLFVTWRGKYIAYWQPCLCTVDNTAFFSSRGQFWDFFPTSLNLLIIFGIWVRIVSIFSSKTVA